MNINRDGLLFLKTFEDAKKIAGEMSAQLLKPICIWQRFDFDNQCYLSSYFIFTGKDGDQRHLDKVVYCVVNYESPYSVTYTSPKHNLELTEYYPTIEQRSDRLNELIRAKYWKNISYK
jgi:hypothetical protein